MLECIQYSNTKDQDTKDQATTNTSWL